MIVSALGPISGLRSLHMSRDGSGVKPISKSSIQITFQYQGVRCRENIQLKPTPANIKRVEKQRAAIIYAIEQGTFEYENYFPESPRAKLFLTTSGQTERVEDYLTDWLRSQKAILKASSYEGYRKVIDNLVIPRFGRLLLPQWKRKDVKVWLEAMSCGNKRLANIQSVIRKALSDAVDDELLDTNFMIDYCYQRKTQIKEEDDIDPFTIEEQRSILAKCSPEMANQIKFSFWTGVRPSELIALSWGDIDFVRGHIKIRRAMTQASKGQAETTKTASGLREIKILGPTLEALQAQKPHSFLKGDPIFLNPSTGQRWTGDQQIRDAWIRILKAAGVRYRWPYQTRHTYASMMVSAGEHPMWVAKQMGHRDWTMIAKIYAKWMPEADEHAGEKAEAIFGSSNAPGGRANESCRGLCKKAKKGVSL